MEKESWLKIEDLTNSSSLSNYTSCPAQTKLQNSITQNPGFNNAAGIADQVVPMWSKFLLWLS